MSINGTLIPASRSQLLVADHDKDDERIGDAIRTGLLAILSLSRSRDAASEPREAHSPILAACVLRDRRSHHTPAPTRRRGMSILGDLLLLLESLPLLPGPPEPDRAWDGAFDEGGPQA